MLFFLSQWSRYKDVIKSKSMGRSREQQVIKNKSIKDKRNIKVNGTDKYI